MVADAADGATGVLLLRMFMLSGLFLLGLAAGKSDLLARIAALRGVLLRAGGLCLAVGLSAGVALRMLDDAAQGFWFLLHLETPLMALGYLMVLSVALQSVRYSWFHDLLAPLGRMSLTAYLTASVLGQLIFYGWGFQLIGQTGTLAVLLLSIGIVFVIGGFAHLWFRHFAYGPWEWLWRSLTHLRPQPMLGRSVAG